MTDLIGGDLEHQVRRRLVGFASRFHIPPAQVWELDTDTWALFAHALDAAVEDERRQRAELERMRR